MQGTPFEQLPSNMERLTTFGWRPVISPDGRELLFVNKEFGDVFTMDLESRRIDCITDTICPNLPNHAVFYRASYLPNGDYLLVGMEKWPQDEPDQRMPVYSRARHEECTMYYLKSGDRRAVPAPFGPKFYEAAAIGQSAMKVAYVENWWSTPDIPEGDSRLFVADLDINGDVPKLVNVKLMLESSFPPDGRLAAVDFYDDDTKVSLITYLYTPRNAAHMLSLDLETGEVIDMTPDAVSADEPAAMFPGASHALIRSSSHVVPDGTKPDKAELAPMDLYKLKLDGTGRECTRLTHVSDFPGFKAHNGSVSPDGKFMVFQISEGAGHGDMLSCGFVKQDF